MTIGEVIKQRRDALGISQASLGKIVGKNDAYISRIEKKSKICVDALVELADALDLNLEDILISAGYIKKDTLFFIPESDITYLSENDVEYINTFIGAIIEKRKREIAL